MTQATRAYTVRLNGKQLVELIKFFEQQQGWRINTIGGFLRDLVDLVHANIQPQLPENCLVENSVEAENFLSRFGSGRTIVNQVSNEANSQVLNFENKNPQRAEKQRQRRQVKKELGLENEKADDSNKLPPHIHKKYRQLDEMEAGIIDAYVMQGYSWPEIEQFVDSILSKQQTDS